MTDEYTSMSTHDTSSKVYFYANLGDLNKPGYGGGEEGNRRTLSILQGSHYNIKIIPKYGKTSGRFPLRHIKLFGKMVANLINFANTMLWGQRRKAIVHIVGFYGVMVYWEYLLFTISNVLGYRTVYEMRGGGADDFYKNGGRFYRHCFRSIVGKSIAIFSQGKENIPLLKSIKPDCDIFYYPNYVMPDFMPEKLPEKNYEVVNCVFFGRLSPSKNIDTILKTIAIIRKNISTPLRLTLIGKFESLKYENEIQSVIKKLDLTDVVEILPPCNHNNLREHLADKHFYIFPTKEVREGHSNAVTEAMAYGIIPIATSQGFNRSVIGNETLITESLDPNEFASITIDIITKRKIEELSEQMYQRVQDNYSYNSVSSELLSKYKSLLTT